MRQNKVAKGNSKRKACYLVLKEVFALSLFPAYQNVCVCLYVYVYLYDMK